MSRILQGSQRSEVERLCREGEAHSSAGETSEALACFMEAWELLPEPREEYPAAGDVFRGFSRVLRARGDLRGGLDLLLAARPGVAPVLAAMGWRLRRE